MDTPSITPPELVTLAEAARIAERSEATIRRWVRDGHLTRHEGQAPEQGGSAPVQVSTRELLVYLATSGQQPRVPPAQPLDDHPGSARVDSPDHPAAVAVELAVLRHQVEAARVEQALRVELAELRAQVEAHRAALARVEAELVDVRRDRDDWRARHDARDAELQAHRQAAGPWWRRLLTGPRQG